MGFHNALIRSTDRRNIVNLYRFPIPLVGGRLNTGNREGEPSSLKRKVSREIILYDSGVGAAGVLFLFEVRAFCTH